MRLTAIPILAISLVCVGIANGQTPLHSQAISKTDPCQPDDGVCWASNVNPRTYVHARAALERIAETGDSDAAYWLAQTFDEDASDNIPIDHTKAYEWYDIAAALKTREIAKEPDADSGNVSAPDTNALQISSRDGCAKYLSAKQLIGARNWSKLWQAAHIPK